jgi:hypothetical protein
MRKIKYYGYWEIVRDPHEILATNFSLTKKDMPFTNLKEAIKKTADRAREFTCSPECSIWWWVDDLNGEEVDGAKSRSKK